MEKKKRFKLTYKPGNMYGPGSNQWAFVKKVPGGYKALCSPMGCKDYIHEGIANKIHDCNLHAFAPSHTEDIDLEHFRIVMFFNDREDLKKHLYSVKKYINTIEKRNGVEQTSILEVDSGQRMVRAFVITAPKIYIESPALHHGLVAMLRTMHFAKQTITKTNLPKILSNLGVKDSTILNFVVKHNIYELLVREHAKVIAGLDLKDIYPKKVTNLEDGYNVSSYHSGFGMVAVCTRRMASKAYSKNIIKVLDDAEIPSYYR